jgi:predicted transcriptional regulator
VDIMASVLTVTEEVAMGKSKIMYMANVSYSRLIDYLNILLNLELIQEVEKGNRTLYETTSKGHAFLHAYRRFRELMSDSEVTELESKTKTESEQTVELKSTTNLDWFRSEVKNLKTRVERLEKFVPKLEFCPTCGKEVGPDFRLCPYCGENLLSKKIEVR